MILLSMLSGAIAGVIILGLVGRFAIAIVSSLIGSNMNLSLSGIFEALMIGTVTGGLLHLLIGRIEYFSRNVQGIVIGSILFALSLVISILFTKMNIDFTGPQFFSLITIFGVYVAYGVSVVTLVNWIKLRGGERIV
jgi:hypothetical protein